MIAATVASLLLGVLVIGYRAQAQLIAPEGSLADALMDMYPQTLIVGGVPTSSYETNVTVVADFSITDSPLINDLSSTMKVSGLLELQWKDEFLRWPAKLPVLKVQQNPDWENIGTISLHSGLVWTPEIIHLENSDDINLLSRLGSHSQILASSSGIVDWKVMAVYNSRCQLTLSKFPFDSQTCVLTLEIKQKSVQFSPFSQVQIAANRQADVNKVDSMWQLSSYAGKVSDELDKFVITFKLKRRPNYCVWNTVIPNAQLAILLLTTYLLPPMEPLRCVHAVSCLLALSFFLVSDIAQMPKSNQVIYLSYYLVCMVVMSAGNALFSGVLCLASLKKDAYGKNAITQEAGTVSTITAANKIGFFVATVMTVVMHAIFYYLMMSG